MGRISTALFHQQGLNSLLDAQQELSKERLKLSTGKEINTPADDPVGSARLVVLKEQINKSEAFQKSINTTNSELALEEVQLKSMIGKLQRIRELGLQSNSGAVTGADLKTLTNEMQQLLDSLVETANANIAGKYIFGGSKGNIRPITKDANGNFQYNGDETQTKVNIGPQLFVNSSDSGRSAFFNVSTNDITTATTSGQTSVTSADPGIVNVGTLGVLAVNELQINGINVKAAVADTVSTTDNTASAIATAAAINASTTKHGVVATVNSNVLDFTGGSYTTTALAAGDFTINGVQITGAAATADAAGLAALVNGLNVPGVTASDNAGQLRLTATDGRNIQIQTDGTTASGINFTNFDLNGAVALNQAKRGTVTLNDHKGFSIAGSAPGDIGLTANDYTVTANTGTATLSNVAIIKKQPDTSLNNEKYLIRFNTPATTFSVFRESDPTSPVTTLEKFSAGETQDDVTKQSNQISTYPASFTAGDTFIVDGVQFQISGTPNANDSFTIELQPVMKQDLFTSTQNLINSINDNSTNSQRRSYEVGLGLDNLNFAQERLTTIQAEVGARLNLLDSQKRTNDDFILFAKEGASNLEDLDIVSAISTILQLQNSLEGAQRSFALINQSTLFDFL